jgi:hypothetical protein
MSGYILLFLTLAVCFLGAGFAVARYCSTHRGSVAGASLAVWIAFLLCGASAIAACFMIVLYYS